MEPTFDTTTEHLESDSDHGSAQSSLVPIRTPRRFWKIGTGPGGKDWKVFCDQGLIAMGAQPEVQDLRTVAARDRDALKAYLISTGAFTAKQPNYAADQYWHFFGQMKPRDVVLAYGNGKLLDVGTIEGDYDFVADGATYPHRRTVQWQGRTPVPASAISADLRKKVARVRGTIADLTEDEFQEIEEAFASEALPTGIDRNSAESAKRIIEGLLPEPASRRQALSRLLTYIDAAHSANPSGWGITLFRNRFRLNVGSVQAFVVYPGDAGATRINQVLDRQSLSQEDEAVLRSAGSYDREEYRAVPNVVDFDCTVESLAAVSSVLERAVEPFATRATTAVSRTPRAAQHSPGVLDYLRSELDRDIPNPAYVSAVGGWVFQANPKTYDLRGAIKSLSDLTWRVPNRRGEVVVGNRVFLYESGPNAGILAAATVTAEAQSIPEDEQERVFYRTTDLLERDDQRVRLHVEQVLPTPLSRTRLQGDPVLSPLAIFRSWQGSNFALTPDQVVALDALMTAPVPSTAYQAILDNLASKRLQFSPEIVSNYLLALQTKRFAILCGISGTGKTQLALSVAACFPKSVQVDTNIPEGLTPLIVHPSYLKYRRILVPAELHQKMRLPEPINGKISAPIPVTYPGGSTHLRLTLHTASSSVVAQLLFDKPFAKWFEQHLAVGQKFYLDHAPSDDDGPDGLVLIPSGSGPTRMEPMRTCEVVPVRPDWTDNRGLLGYHNPISNTYQSTKLLGHVLDAAEEYEANRTAAHPYFLVLDEMNLARVEHYFSDFLSCLESGESLPLHSINSIPPPVDERGRSIPKDLRLPPNLFITGTVNIDETTFMFSPKVLDRAFTLEFNEVNLTDVGPAPTTSSLRLDSLPSSLQFERNPNGDDWKAFGDLEGGALRTLVVGLHSALAEDQRHFGYRVANEIARFVNLASVQAGTSSETLWAALDLAILQKVLPKFHGTQQELEKPLCDLFSFTIAGFGGVSHERKAWKLEAGSLAPLPASGVTPTPPTSPPRLPRTAAKLWRMLRRLEQQGFTSFME